MNIQLNSKNALVGASTQGIGYAIAVELAKCGANVTLMARNETKLKKAVSSLPRVNDSQKHQYVVADFSDFEKFQVIISEFFKENTVDILVNNTNGPAAGMALGMDISAYQQAFDLVFKTVCQTTSLALPHMIKQKNGRIINVSSISVREPVANLVLSNSMRMATLGWAKSFSAEVARYNITVNNILTGYFDTERITNLIDKEAEISGKNVADIRKTKESEVPMNRLGKPEEYGYLAAFLASDFAAYLTGANIPLDGGLSKGY